MKGHHLFLVAASTLAAGCLGTIPPGAIGEIPLRGSARLRDRWLAHSWFRDPRPPEGTHQLPGAASAPPDHGSGVLAD